MAAQCMRKAGRDPDAVCRRHDPACVAVLHRKQPTDTAHQLPAGVSLGGGDTVFTAELAKGDRGTIGKSKWKHHDSFWPECAIEWLGCRNRAAWQFSLTKEPQRGCRAFTASALLRGSPDE